MKAKILEKLKLTGLWLKDYAKYFVMALIAFCTVDLVKKVFKNLTKKGLD